MAGIYLHIPFCKKLCAYCDFYHILSAGDNQEYVDSILKEAFLQKDYLGNESVSTIYLGGGTPSLLTSAQIAEILNGLGKIFRIEEDSEITVEMNPDDVVPDFLADIRAAGVNRVSLGVQSWRDEDLKLLNRRHNSAQAAYALEEAFRAGFQNITIDLIYGIPGMKAADLAANLSRTFSYDIKHLSAYHLTIEPHTVFGRMKEKGLLKETDEEESNIQFNLLIEKAEAAGFIHYEISNFGKQGYFSVHNSSYWKQVNYLGLGPSAHSFNGYSRQWNIRDVRKYINAVMTGTLLFEKEDLDSRIRFNEYIMTSLRTMWGIDLGYVEGTFSKEGYDYLINLAGKFINYGLMKMEKNTLILSNQGKMISDNIISELMLPDGD